jgi:hypothetical protein
MCRTLPIALALLFALTGVSCASRRGPILENLDEGMLRHYEGRYGESSVALEAAERAIEDAFTKSISAEVATYLVNDNARPYAGEDYENIYLNAFNALNSYHRDNLEDALVEIRRMGEKLQGLDAKYAILFDTLPENNGPESRSSKYTRSQFSDSALARYLGLLFYRAWGNIDDARIDRDRLALAFQNAPMVYTFPVPKSVREELDIPRGKGRLNVIAFSGLGPLKQEDVTYIPLSGMGLIKIALPVLVSRPSRVTSIECVVQGGPTFNLELLEDMDAVARETFRNKVSFVYTKTIIRATLKAAGGMILTEAARNTDDDDVSLLLGILGLAGKLFAVASERADTRGSHYLPAKAYIGGTTLDPGTYKVTVNYYQERKILESFSFTQVVKAGALNLTETSYLK